MGNVDLVALITPDLEEAKSWIMRGYDRKNGYTVLNLLPDALARVKRARERIAEHRDLTTQDGKAEEQRARLLCLDVEARLHSGVAFAFAAFENASNPSVIGLRDSHAKEALTLLRVPEMRDVFDDADVLKEIAGLEDLLGNSDAALEAYQGVLKYDPDGVHAEKAKKRIAEITEEQERARVRQESALRTPELRGTGRSVASENIPQWDAWLQKHQTSEARNLGTIYVPLAFLLLFVAFIGFMFRTCDDGSTTADNRGDVAREPNSLIRFTVCVNAGMGHPLSMAGHAEGSACADGSGTTTEEAQRTATLAACHKLEKVLEAQYDSRYRIGFMNKATVEGLCEGPNGMAPIVKVTSARPSDEE